ncbi:MAG TPA: translation elongation factor Ts [Spirochaetota bacterium]|nr:translation elongation factor Ts [Spirochaetota bacterium]
MAAVTPVMIKELREKTQAGMVDCKKALEETNGDMDAAVDFLRKKGLASANKRLDRAVKEGLVVIETADNGKTAYMVQVNCETDFVAKNDDFKKLVQEILKQSIATGKEKITKDELPAALDELIKGQIAKTGENTQFGGFVKVTTASGLLSTYVHLNNKIGVILELESNPDVSSNADVQTLGKDICLQIAAMSPQFIDSSEISEDVKEKERVIYREQLKDSGKPAPVIEKIVEGKLGKFYSEVCLVDQEFIKEGGKKISAVVKEKGDALKSKIAIKKFIRFQIGA